MLMVMKQRFKPRRLVRAFTMVVLGIALALMTLRSYQRAGRLWREHRGKTTADFFVPGLWRVATAVKERGIDTLWLAPSLDEPYYRQRLLEMVYPTALRRDSEAAPPGALVARLKTDDDAPRGVIVVDHGYLQLVEVQP